MADLKQSQQTNVVYDESDDKMDEKYMRVTGLTNIIGQPSKPLTVGNQNNNNSNSISNNNNNNNNNKNNNTNNYNTIVKSGADTIGKTSTAKLPPHRFTIVWTESEKQKWIKHLCSVTGLDSTMDPNTDKSTLFVIDNVMMTVNRLVFSEIVFQIFVKNAKINDVHISESLCLDNKDEHKTLYPKDFFSFMIRSEAATQTETYESIELTENKQSLISSLASLEWQIFGCCPLHEKVKRFSYSFLGKRDSLPLFDILQKSYDMNMKAMIDIEKSSILEAQRLVRSEEARKLEMWSCKHCTSHNPIHLQKCSVCDMFNAGFDYAGSSAGAWECIQCTFNNPSSAQTCNICQFNRNRQLNDNKNNNNNNKNNNNRKNANTIPWKCQQCNFQNVHSAICGGCNLTRADSLRITMNKLEPDLNRQLNDNKNGKPRVDSYAKWRCSFCNRLNDKKDVVCGCGIMPRDSGNNKFLETDLQQQSKCPCFCGFMSDSDPCPNCGLTADESLAQKKKELFSKPEDVTKEWRCRKCGRSQPFSDISSCVSCQTPREKYVCENKECVAHKKFILISREALACSYCKTPVPEMERRILNKNAFKKENICPYTDCSGRTKPQISDHCVHCYFRGNNNNNNNNTNTENSSKDDDWHDWQCKNPVCNQWNGKIVKNCYGCGLYKDVPYVPQRPPPLILPPPVNYAEKWQQWKCPNVYCGTLNNKATQECVTCTRNRFTQQPRKSINFTKPWICPNGLCRAVNNENTEYCYSCQLHGLTQQEKNVQNQQPSTLMTPRLKPHLLLEESGWKCSCGQLNHHELDNCDTCESARVWECICECKNPFRKMSCTKCSHQFDRNKIPWKCNLCDGSNKPLKSKHNWCTTCYNVWQCHTCFVQNKYEPKVEGNEQCLNCGERRAPIPYIDKYLTSAGSKENPVVDQKQQQKQQQLKQQKQIPAQKNKGFLFNADVSWQCPVCDLTNKKEDKRCISCQAVFPVINTTNMDQKHFSSTTTTLGRKETLNPSSISSQDSTSTSTSTSSSSKEKTSEPDIEIEWQCSVCTALNTIKKSNLHPMWQQAIKTARCEVCNNKKDSQ